MPLFSYGSCKTIVCHQHTGRGLPIALDGVVEPDGESIRPLVAPLLRQDLFMRPAARSSRTPTSPALTLSAALRSIAPTNARRTDAAQIIYEFARAEWLDRLTARFDATIAEEALQNLMMGLLRRTDPIEVTEDAPSYLYRAYLNACFEVLRNRPTAYEPLESRPHLHAAGELDSPDAWEILHDATVVGRLIMSTTNHRARTRSLGDWICRHLVPMLGRKDARASAKRSIEEMVQIEIGEATQRELAWRTFEQTHTARARRALMVLQKRHCRARQRLSDLLDHPSAAVRKLGLSSADVRLLTLFLKHTLLCT